MLRSCRSHGSPCGIVVRRELVEVTNSRTYLGEFFFRPGGHPLGEFSSGKIDSFASLKSTLGIVETALGIYTGAVVDPLFRGAGDHGRPNLHRSALPSVAPASGRYVQCNDGTGCLWVELTLINQGATHEEQ
jgi:hypothetical protein